MESLLKITNIPIVFEMKINKARLEYKNGTADLEISRNKGQMKISSSPIRLNIDTFEARNSVSPASVSSSLQKYAESGKSAVYQAMATSMQHGKLMLKAKLGEDAIGQIIQDKTDKYFVPPNIGIDFIPSTQAELNWSKPDVTIEYQMDKMNFDWRILKGDFEFIPGDIEFNITQYPDVMIEYIGGPIYVPPSADPESQNIDVKA